MYRSSRGFFFADGFTNSVGSMSEFRYFFAGKRGGTDGSAEFKVKIFYKASLEKG
jgi:hypothetical protein